MLSKTVPSDISRATLLTPSRRFMTAPLYVVALIIAVPVCWYADKISPYRPVIAAISLGIGAVFCALTAGIRQYTARYVFLCFVNSAAWTAAPLGLSFSATSLASCDPETRAISLAIIVICGTCGQFWGTALYPASDAPAYLTGFSACSALLAVSAALYLLAFVMLRRFPFKPSY